MRALTLLSFLLLSACGQSGDLYLPADKPEPAPAAPAQPPSEEKDETKDRK